MDKQQGVGLIEVLVAVLLLSVAVLGFSALQLRAISATEESLVRTQALSVVRGLAENMRANPSQMETYEDAINDASTVTGMKASSCKDFSEACTAEEIAVKEAEAAIIKLDEYGISMTMDSCPGTTNSGVDDFSEIKCIIAAWGDTQPKMLDDSDDTNKNACANENGIYNRGSTCIIVEAY